ncbi:MAG TPA: hypothetical protein VFN94_11375, partial [Nitrospiria bacterium]|nr:hypothetical protein [Nitrospiria bacterium]
MTVTRGRTPWSLLGVIGALTALVIAAHGGALRGTFHYDDLFAVVNNPAVRSWDPVRIARSTEAVNSERNASGYRPLTVGSLALNYRLSGLDASGYLATNLLLHVLASALVVLLARELLGDLRWAAAAGAVFALHPVNAEAVNYVTARSSLLSTVFALAAAWAFVRDAEGRAGVGGRAAGLVAFLCALLSKESAVALAAPVLVYPWLFRRRPSDAKAFSRGVRAAAGYGVVAAGFVAGFGLLTAGGTTVLVPGQRPAWTFLEMVGRSMALWVWPWPLGLDHPLTFLSRFDAVLAAVLLIGAAGFVAAVLWLRARAPAAAWGMIWAAA